MYKVIRAFEDKDKRKYAVGDEYPHKDAKKATNARLKALSSTDNKYKKVYIEEVETEADKE